MNMLSLFPAIPVLMMLGLWLSKSARQVRAVMVAGSSLLLALAHFFCIFHHPQSCNPLSFPLIPLCIAVVRPLIP